MKDSASQHFIPVWVLVHQQGRIVIPPGVHCLAPSTQLLFLLLQSLELHWLHTPQREFEQYLLYEDELAQVSFSSLYI